MNRCILATMTLCACGGTSAAPNDVANDQRGAALDAAAFRNDANALAERLGAVVKSWGTAELDEHAGRDLFAVMTTDENVDYVIETGDGWFLIRGELDGKTSPWRADEDAASPPVWEEAEYPSIDHQQAWSAGFGRYEVAIRGAKVVVLRDSSIEDSREDDTEIPHDYGVNGADLTKLGASSWLTPQGPVPVASDLN
jgi:hypothetical protein